MAVLDLCRYPTYSIYQPHSSVIAAISQSSPAIVTTHTNHDLVDGTIVRLTISPNCGMQQVNGMFGPVTITSPTTFTIPLDTTYFDPFIIPEDPDHAGSPPPHQQPCSFSIPIGELNGQLNAAVHNITG